MRSSCVGLGFDDATHREKGAFVLEWTVEAEATTRMSTHSSSFILRTLAAATKGPKERRGSEGAYGVKMTSHDLGGTGRGRVWLLQR
jgi:hypothetical protein